MNQTELVVDSEGVKVTESSDVEVMKSLENLIQSGIKEEADLKKKINLKKEMIDSVLENDSTFRDHADQAKEAARIKAATKKEIFRRPDVAPIVQELKELKDDRKNNKQEMSSYLVEYMRIGKQLMLDFGETQYEIVETAFVRKRIS